MNLHQEESFSGLLKEYRRAMGWTQEETAKHWNYSFETISAWERGKRNPSNHEIPRLAHLLNVEPETLAQYIGSRTKTSRNDLASSAALRQERLKTFDLWGELQGIYRNRTEFNSEFSYPRMFENAQSILAVGISLNAVALNYSREKIIESIVEQKRTYQLCFLDPESPNCTEREQEEELLPGTIADLTRINMHHIHIIQNHLRRINPELVNYLQMSIYDASPRLNIYIVDDTLMTVQCYAYSRGEDTPTFVLRRQSNNGLFEFYARSAKYIFEQSKPFTYKDHR